MSDAPLRPPIASAPLSVVLTAWNDAIDLEEVLGAWMDYLDGLKRSYEVLLVDDGSEDDTRERVSTFAARWPALRVLQHESHQGIGTALRTGIAAAQHPLIFTAPADKQFHPPDLKQVLGIIDQVDLVVGYRVWRPVPAWLRVWDGFRRAVVRLFLGAMPEPREFWGGWSGWSRRFAARWVFGVRVQDPECDYRLYRREVFARLPIQCHSAAARIEILAKANHLECIMAEVPVSWMPRSTPQHDPVDARMGNELRRLFSAPEFTASTQPLSGGSIS